MISTSAWLGLTGSVYMPGRCRIGERSSRISMSSAVYPFGFFAIFRLPQLLPFVGGNAFPLTASTGEAATPALLPPARGRRHPGSHQRAPAADTASHPVSQPAEPTCTGEKT